MIQGITTAESGLHRNPENLASARSDRCNPSAASVADHLQAGRSFVRSLLRIQQRRCGGLPAGVLRSAPEETIAMGAGYPDLDRVGRRGRCHGQRGKESRCGSQGLPVNRLLADNRQARHQYEILETLETGIEQAIEVKSIRAGKANLRDGFCLIRSGELQLHNVHISPHSHASGCFNHDPLRTRKLLAPWREMDNLEVSSTKRSDALSR